MRGPMLPRRRPYYTLPSILVVRSHRHAGNIFRRQDRRLRALRSLTYIDIRLTTGSRSIFGRNTALELKSLGGVHEIHGAATEAASGHARSVDTTLPRSNLYHHVEFTAAHLIVVPQTLVRLGQQTLKRGDVPLFQSFRRPAHAVILRKHMTATAEQRVREALPMLLQLRERHVA